jgi:hypothetical protein
VENGDKNKNSVITAAEQKIKLSFSCIFLQSSETSISVHHQKILDQELN